MHIKQPASALKNNPLTSTIQTSRFTVKAFEESADGSAFIFLRDLHISVGLFKLGIPTKVTSKRINQANNFYSTSICVPLRIHSTEVLFI